MKTKVLCCVLGLILSLAVPASMAAAIPQPGIPMIDVEKYVSLDAIGTGVAWEDADDLPGPYGLAGDEVSFKYWVKNTGTVPFYSVQLIEGSITGLSGCAVIEPFMPGDTFECVIGPFPIPAGQNSRPVTAIGRFGCGSVEDSDGANYYGVMAAIDLETLISVDGQATWSHADDPPGPYVLAGSELYFKYRGTNSGNVPLNGISLSDASITAEQSSCIILEPLMPGGAFECVVGPLPAQAGQQVHFATARGKFLGWSAQDSDAASYFGAVVQLDIENYVGFPWPDITGLKWYDADEPPGLIVVVGSDLYFKWSGLNSGNVPLESIRLLGDSTILSSCAIAEPVMPGASFECVSGPFRAQDGLHGFSTAAEGRSGEWITQDSDTAYYTGVYVDGEASDGAARDAAGAEGARY